jgi:hypothetical protein
MESQELETLKYIFTLTEKELQMYLKLLLEDRGYNVVVGYDKFKSEEVAYVYGRYNPTQPSEALLLAHTDTVHFDTPTIVFHDQEYGVMWTPDGLGADDRAGVFAILQLMKEHPVDVLFTADEENGGNGAQDFADDRPDNPGYKVLIQLDRRNSEDAVFYDNDCEEFHDYIQTYGFKKAHGSFSDISVIAPYWKVNSVNLSVGYYHEHTLHECLVVHQLLRTIDKVNHLLADGIQEFPYKEKYTYVKRYGNDKNKTSLKPVNRLYGSEYDDYGYNYDNHGYEYDDYGCAYNPKRNKNYKDKDSYVYDDEYVISDEQREEIEEDRCEFCGEKFRADEEIRLIDGLYICKECYQEQAFRCAECGGLFLTEFHEESWEQFECCTDCYNAVFADVKNAVGDNESSIVPFKKANN